MKESKQKRTSRREFLKNTGRIAVTSALATGLVPLVHAAENNTINVALVGCGGRGAGACLNLCAEYEGGIEGGHGVGHGTSGGGGQRARKVAASRRTARGESGVRAAVHWRGGRRAEVEAR